MQWEGKEEIFSNPLTLFVWANGTVLAIDRVLSREELEPVDKKMLKFAVKFLKAAAAGLALVEGKARGTSKQMEETQAFLRSLQGIHAVDPERTGTSRIDEVFQNWITELNNSTTNKNMLKDVREFFSAIRELGLQESAPKPERVLIYE